MKKLLLYQFELSSPETAQRLTLKEQRQRTVKDENLGEVLQLRRLFEKPAN